MLAQLHFQIGPIVQTDAPIGSYPLWCDDSAVAERLIQVVKNSLLERINAESCLKANCSLFTARCLLQNSTDDGNSIIIRYYYTFLERQLIFK